MGITTSKSSALSINTPFIFGMQLINDPLFLNATASFGLRLLGTVTVTICSPIIYASL